MTESDVVTWTTVAPGVTRVDLGRAPANALGLPILRGLEAALDAAEADGNVKILILASTIPGFFAAGADIIRRQSETVFVGAMAFQSAYVWMIAQLVNASTTTT